MIRRAVVSPVFWTRLLLVALLVPMATGTVVVTYRDAVVTHFPARAAALDALRSGRIPFLHPAASCVEPLAGNPNFAVFFPDTILALLFPLPVGIGLHFALALVLGYWGARRWARAEGASRHAAEAGALSFVCSGIFVSAWTFYNAGMTLAVAPWVLAAAAKLSRRNQEEHSISKRVRSAGELGLSSALSILAGEPVISLLTLMLGVGRAFWGAEPRAVPRLLSSLAGAALLAGCMAAPQIALTAQALPGSSRHLAPFQFDGATATSVHPMRSLEQWIPFPFGRPDRMGEGGFAGHPFFQGTAPYLWTLHLGWLPLFLLLGCGAAPHAARRLYGLTLPVALLLSLGSYLPGSRWLFPLLSLGGRIRYPVKAWYLVALAVVPLVAYAAERFLQGDSVKSRRSMAVLAVLVGGSVVAMVTGLAAWDSVSLLGLVVSAGAIAWVHASGRIRAPRSAWPILAGIELPAVVFLAPLWIAAVDRPPAFPAALPEGRVYERVGAQAHDPDVRREEPALRTRDFFRRAAPERWSLTGGVSGQAYAFDRDPDGSYSFYDRVVREGVDSLPWPDRAMELRLAGVRWIVSSSPLEAPYHLVRQLDAARGVGLYELHGAPPSVRLPLRIHRSPHFNGTLDLHRRSGFHPAVDVVLPGSAREAAGPPLAGEVSALEESTDRLRVETRSPTDGVLVWSRSYLPAWRARVDGVAATVIPADGHLVGVHIPAGEHRVEIIWPRAPFAWGASLSLLGLTLLATVRRLSHRLR